VSQTVQELSAFGRSIDPWLRRGWVGCGTSASGSKTKVRLSVFSDIAASDHKSKKNDRFSGTLAVCVRRIRKHSDVIEGRNVAM
jgi:hypothetical protein